VPHSFDEHGHDFVQPPSHAQSRDLNRKPFAVAIDDQAAQPVGFAKHQPRRAFGVVQSQLRAKLECRIQASSPKSTFQRFFIGPGIEPDANSALTVENTAGDEFARFAQQVNDIAILGRALDSRDRRIEHPGMTPIKRARLARFEDHLCHGKAGGRFKLGRLGRGKSR
jgi:hypothetical protein